MGDAMRLSASYLPTLVSETDRRYQFVASVPHAQKWTMVMLKWGSKYSGAYVEALRAAIRRHIEPNPLLLDIVCFTDELNDPSLPRSSDIEYRCISLTTCMLFLFI
jgi:hypothetical protein